MSDLIDRQKTLEKIYQLPIIDRDAYDFYRDVRESIKSMPSAEPKKGRWNRIGFNIECSLCGFTPCFDSTEPLYNYCPHCGAKMEVE